MDLQIKDTLVHSFPFATLIDSNYIPSDSETEEIKKFLVGPTRKLQEMEIEIARLSTKLHNLTASRDNLHRELEACRSLITPGRRVPDDILREIFHQCLPEDRNVYLRNNTAPLIFTRICSNWRQVAISTPTIWTTLHLSVVRQKSGPPYGNDFTSDPGEWDERRVFAALTWLERSATRPLHIAICRDQNQKEIPKYRFFESYVSTIIPFASRWKTLFLEGSYCSFTQFLKVPPSNLQSLESLFLHFQPHEDDTYPQTIASYWADCALFKSSSLRRLSIRQGSVEIWRFHVNWSQLTHLDLGCPTRSWAGFQPFSFSTLSTILGNALLLVECRLQFREYSPFGETEIMAVHLPLLRRLIIETDVDIFPLTDCLHTPALQDIQFKTNVIELGTAWLVPLFRSPIQIQRLVVDSRYLKHTSFLEILRKCPGLTSLTIKRSPMQKWEADERRYHGYYHQKTAEQPLRVDDSLLEQINMEGSDLYFPRLDELTCDYITEFSALGMIDFIRKKQRGTAGLAKLKNVSISNIISQVAEDFNDGNIAEELLLYTMLGMGFKLEPSTDPEGLDYSQYADYWKD